VKKDTYVIKRSASIKEIDLEMASCNEYSDKQSLRSSNYSEKRLKLLGKTHRRSTINNGARTLTGRISVYCNNEKGNQTK
jgi:hypothetical protein